MNESMITILFSLSPILVLVFTSLFALFSDLFHIHKKVIFGFTLMGLLLSLSLTLPIFSYEPIFLFHEAIRIDRYTLFFTFVSLVLTTFTLLNTYPLLKNSLIPTGEFFFFILSCCLGMILLAASTNLMTFFMSLEIMSICAYVLTGIQREKFSSVEGAFKYFLLGAFSTGFLLYGMALLYACVGSTQYSDISNFLMTSRYAIPAIFYIGVGLMLTGFSFKIGAVPFHMWVPDVYEAAHPVVTGFMATAIKAAAFAALGRLFFVTLLSIQTDWNYIAVIVAIATMTVGNIAALVQKNLKRMLAYSSIAHAGYLLVAAAATSGENFELGMSAILFYIVAYGLMTLGAFSVIEKDQIQDYAGYGFSRPLLGFFITVFMLSLTGIPLTAGFLGKFYILGAALKTKHFVLVVTMILNSVIAAYYYLRVIVTLYMQKEKGDQFSSAVSYPVWGTLFICAGGTIWLGVWPSSCIKLIKLSIASLL